MKDNDPAVIQCLEEWRHFYPVRIPEDAHFGDGTGGVGGAGAAGFGLSSSSASTGVNAGINKVPAVVEVIVGGGGGTGNGGVRMKYPSCHVLVPAKSENPLDCVGGVIPRVVSVQRAPTPASVSPTAAAVAATAPTPNAPSPKTLLQQQQQQNLSLTLTPPTSPADQLLMGNTRVAAVNAAKSQVPDVQGQYFLRFLSLSACLSLFFFVFPCL